VHLVSKTTAHRGRSFPDGKEAILKSVKISPQRAAESEKLGSHRIGLELLKQPKAKGAAGGGKRSGLRGNIVLPRKDEATLAELTCRSAKKNR
jgi:hypothetical protein